MKMSAQTARDIRAFIKQHTPGRHMVEGSYRAGTPKHLHGDPAEGLIDPNRLLFRDGEQDLHDYIPWSDVRKMDYRTHLGEVELDLYVYEGYGDNRELWDVFVARFDGDGLIAINDYSRNRWQRDA